MRTVYVAEYPAIQHRHRNGDIVTVKLRRKSGELRAACSGCDTEFVYRKPRPSSIRHYKSPLLARREGQLRRGGRRRPLKVLLNFFLGTRHPNPRPRFDAREAARSLSRHDLHRRQRRCDAGAGVRRCRRLLRVSLSRGAGRRRAATSLDPIGGGGDRTQPVAGDSGEPDRAHQCVRAGGGSDRRARASR